MQEARRERATACQASGIARSTLRYRPVARDDSGVITFIQAHMALNPRHGFGLPYDSARHQGKLRWVCHRCMDCDGTAAPDPIGRRW